MPMYKVRQTFNLCIVLHEEKLANCNSPQEKLQRVMEVVNDKLGLDGMVIRAAFSVPTLARIPETANNG